jgi:VWFA-related protein
VKRSVFIAFFVTALATAPAFAQSTAPDPNAPVTNLFITSHAVLIDVVVTDKEGVPVTGLKKDAFSVTEQGKPQTVSFFEEHKGPSTPPAGMPELPPNVFSNFSPVGQPAAVNILLLDSLNTPAEDQTFARKQAMNFLRTLKPGYRMAIFTMSGGLHYVQGFTDDPALLVAALANKKNNTVEAPAFMASAQEADAQSVLTSTMASIASVAVDPNGGVHLGYTANPAMTAALENFFQVGAVAQQSEREYQTLHNLQQLATFLAAFPGRKNLIWFSESFPVNLFGSTDPRFEGDVKKTINLLTAARVAVFPVDARGLKAVSFYDAGTQQAAIGGNGLPGTMSGMTATHNTNPGNDPALNTSALDAASTKTTDPMQEGPQSSMNAAGSPNIAEASERNSDQATMQMLAEQTGGKAFINTNGLQQVISNVVTQSSDFYTVSYAPTNTKMDDTFRKVDIKVSGGKYNLSFRHGYYARNLDLPGNGQVANGKPSGDPLAPFMEFGMPQTEQILYKTRVQSVTPKLDAAALEDKKAGIHYSVDFAIDLKDVVLKLDPADGLHKGTLNLSLIVFDRYGVIASRKDHRVALAVKPDAYAAFSQDGIQLHAEIDVPKGQYFLRTGVLDAATNKTGTMEIPLGLVKDAAAPAQPKPAADKDDDDGI